MVALLRRRNFALLWCGQCVSLLGDWLLLIALPFFIYQRTGSALATGSIFFVEAIPSLLFGTVAGVFVDRWNRRWTMIVADLSRAMILLPLLLLSAHNWAPAREAPTYIIVYVVTFIQSTISEFFSPAEGALIPYLVAEAQLSTANALNALAVQLTRLIGPPLGGAMLALLGPNSVILADSASYVFSAAMILLIILPRLSSKQEEPISKLTDMPAARGHETPGQFSAFWHDWVEGLQLIRKQRVIAALFITVAISMIGEGLGRAIFVPFLSRVAGGNSFLFSMIFMSQGAGAIIGSLLIDRITKVLHPFTLLALGASIAGILVMIETLFPLLPVVIICTFLAGAPIVFFFVVVYTLLQRLTTDRYRGRVLGAYNNTVNLLVLVGMALASILADRLGAILIFGAGAAFYLLAGLTAFALLHRTRLPEEITAQENAVPDA